MIMVLQILPIEKFSSDRMRGSEQRSVQMKVSSNRHFGRSLMILDDRMAKQSDLTFSESALV